MKKITIICATIIACLVWTMPSFAEPVGPNGGIGEPMMQENTQSLWDAMTDARIRICIRMTNPDTPGVEFFIQCWPGGYITGSICGAPEWQVQSVTVNRPTKSAELYAIYLGSGACAYDMTLTVTKSRRMGVGEYCWNDGATCYPAEVTLTRCNF